MNELLECVVDITPKPVKPGSPIVDVVCRLNGSTVFRDRITPAKSSDRHRFAAAVIETIGERAFVERQTIETRLMEIADQLDDDKASEVLGDDTGLDLGEEVSVKQVLRPELIITENLSAIAIPSIREQMGQKICQWLHLRIINGRRERVVLRDQVDVPGDGAYWLEPMPQAPTSFDVKKFSQWSPESRRDWLLGSIAPMTAEVLSSVEARINRYLVMPSDYAAEHRLTLAAWVMMTYAYPALSAVPYLYLSGPPNSGKTRTMELLSRMVFRPTMTANLTGAALYRTRDMYGGVLLYDEAERMQAGGADVASLRSILLAGYKRDAVTTRIDSQGDKQVPKPYSCYGPVVLGAIQAMPAALASRCITIQMLRARDEDPQGNRSLDDEPQEERGVRDMLHCWALEHAYRVITMPLPKVGVANRDYELWAPLLRIVADAGDLDAFNRMVAHAERSSKIVAEDSAPVADPVILAALRSLVSSGQRPTPGEVLRCAHTLDPDAMDRHWKAKRVSNVLSQYGFRTRKSRGRKEYHVDPSKITDAMVRYSYNAD